MAHTRILLATHNAHKRDEIARLLHAPRGSVLIPRDWNDEPPHPIESGFTYEENALIKARAFSRWSGLVALADDSGIEVDALDGAPGVQSANFAGPGADAAENFAKLLAALRGVPAERRQARFVCALALCSGERILFSARETCAGLISETPAGTAGFGYDPVFIPAGESATFAAMSPADKDRISHRGKALRRLAAALAAGELPIALGDQGR